MKKDVLINIKGIYQNTEDYEDIDVVEIFTTGKYYKRDGDYYISYKDTQATGFEGSRTTLRVQNQDKVYVSRTGKVKSQLIVEPGVRHQCHYDVGFGDLMIGISDSHIKSNLGDKGGNLMIRYSMDVNTMLTSENEMLVHVQESGV